MDWSSQDSFYNDSESVQSAEDDCELYKRFDIIKVIGHGRTATVLLCKSKEDHPSRKYPEYVAIKRMELLNKENLEQSIRELSKILNIRSSTDISSIVEYYDWFTDISLRGKGWTLCHVMKYYNNGSVMRLLRDKNIRNGEMKIPEQFILEMMFQITKALVHIHEKHNITHRDISPNNILINFKNSDHVQTDILLSPQNLSSLEFILVDFGFAQNVESSQTYSEVGTYKYIAPEIRLSKKYSKKVDIFSFGILLLNLCFGEELDLYEQIRNSPNLSILSILNSLTKQRKYSKTLISLLLKTIEFHPTKRISSSQLSFFLHENFIQPSISNNFQEKIRAVPDELFVSIFSYLNYTELEIISSVSKHFNFILHKYSNYIYKILYDSYFIPTLNISSESGRKMRVDSCFKLVKKLIFHSLPTKKMVEKRNLFLLPKNRKNAVKMKDEHRYSINYKAWFFKRLEVQRKYSKGVLYNIKRNNNNSNFSVGLRYFEIFRKRRKKMKSMKRDEIEMFRIDNLLLLIYAFEIFQCLTFSSNKSEEFKIEILKHQILILEFLRLYKLAKQKYNTFISSKFQDDNSQFDTSESSEFDQVVPLSPLTPRRSKKSKKKNRWKNLGVVDKDSALFELNEIYMNCIQSYIIHSFLGISGEMETSIFERFTFIFDELEEFNKIINMQYFTDTNEKNKFDMSPKVLEYFKKRIRNLFVFCSSLYVHALSSINTNARKKKVYMCLFKGETSKASRIKLRSCKF